MKGRLAPANGSGPRNELATTPAGSFVVVDGESLYRIANCQYLDPFLVSLASATDLWMFVASGGGLAAGRVDADGSLFPYITVDQLHDAHHHTGPLTLIRIERGRAAAELWEPFAESGADAADIERNLYKNTLGSRLVFEEIHHGLKLAFRYSWSASDDFGWVRSATLENRSGSPLRVSLLDGLRNILPHGAPLSLYQQASNLVDAYKKSEVDPESGLGLFSLTAGITDRAEALESLKANTVWCCGLDDYRVHLSQRVVRAFRRGQVLTPERVLNGARGNYLVSCTLELPPADSARWHLAADVAMDQVRVAERRRFLLDNADPAGAIQQSLRFTEEALVRNVASADGLQASASLETSTHHFANVLFNNMRGGVFDRNYDVDPADLTAFLEVRNPATAQRQAGILAALPVPITIQTLLADARGTGDADFERLCHEYLPLYFGRRHGDPSRPWNRFSVRARGEDGGRVLNYEGNWRDIFQNWEALSTAFPGFLPNIVAKFVNASTIDGFNPYRVTRDGVDWETVSPEDPWSNIGYWGDHQIIYLLKLLEGLTRHDPVALDDLLTREIFSYAEVPYLIKPYADLLADTQSTIDFDTERAERIAARVAEHGTDGKLLRGPDGAVLHVNLLEKLLVPALSKLSNLVPDAGIWMNTQRPEWNDANNALGGGGVSVVTLCHLRRYLAFLADTLGAHGTADLPLSAEVATWLGRIGQVLEAEHRTPAGTRIDAVGRKRILDALGKAFSDYRQTVYAHGLSRKIDVPVAQVGALCRTALAWIDQGLSANRRDDGLYHAYNLLEFSDDGHAVDIVHLPIMLEGQVAVLSSGACGVEETQRLVDGLFASPLYRADQHSFMLYPERSLPGFLEKNRIPDAVVASLPLAAALLETDDRSVLSRDVEGVCRFNGALRNGVDLEAALDALQDRPEWTDRVAADRQAVLDLFESVFHHKSYTGRSGVMYGYEGLGCIYWHMVAKLLLSVQEVILRAERDGRPRQTLTDLIARYYRIRAGLGYEKSVVEYGAFPTDPYSHTPSGGGAKQPGMTGQVKEEILTRRGELGIRVRDGRVRFRPVLLRANEFMAEPTPFEFVGVNGNRQPLALDGNSLAFTFCQVPVVYHRVDGAALLQVEFADGTHLRVEGDDLDESLSSELFSRSGRIAAIRVDVPAERLYSA